MRIGWGSERCQPADTLSPLSAHLELLAQSQALPLIRRPDADAVNLLWRLQQSHVRKTRDNLAMFNQKGHFMRSDLQDGAGPRKIVHAIAKPGSKKPA